MRRFGDGGSDDRLLQQTLPEAAHSQFLCTGRSANGSADQFTRPADCGSDSAGGAAGSGRTGSAGRPRGSGVCRSSGGSAPGRLWSATGRATGSVAHATARAGAATTTAAEWRLLKRQLRTGSELQRASAGFQFRQRSSSLRLRRRSSAGSAGAPKHLVNQRTRRESRVAP